MIGGSGESEASSVALAVLEKKTVLALLAESPHASLVLDGSGKIVYCSRAWLDLLQQSREAMLGLRLEAVVALRAGNDGPSLVSGRLWAGEVWAWRADGVRIPLDLSRSPVFDAAGDLMAVLIQAAARPSELGAIAAQPSEERGSDITTPRAEMGPLALRALTDPLTGLANRPLLHDRLERALARLSRHEGTVAVMCLGVDRSMMVNETFGHGAGDELLVAIGGRIRRSIRTTDTVARSGGAEFVVVAEDIRFHDEPASIAERMIAAVGDPLELAGRLVTPSISVGIVSTASGGRTPDELVRNAETAMYNAKELGGGSFALFNGAMGRLARRRQELEGSPRASFDSRWAAL